MLALPDFIDISHQIDFYKQAGSQNICSTHLFPPLIPITSIISHQIFFCGLSWIVCHAVILCHIE